MPELLEGECFTVTGASRACFFPRTELETSYTREFDGRTPEGSYDLFGSVYGRSLRFLGSGCCRGLVVSRGDLIIDVSRSGEQTRFLGSLSANGAIVVKTPTAAMHQTLCADIKRASLLVRGDVVGDQIDLSNAIIVGNLHATNIRLTNCVVFGSVIATERILLHASSVLYYHSREIQFAGPCMMINAMGESASMPMFAPYEDAKGNIFPPDVRYYPVVRAQEGKSLTNRPWSREPSATASRLFPAADWIPVATESIGAKSGELGIGIRTVLTIAGRALNLASLQLATGQLTSMLRIAFEFDHYSPKHQREALERIAAISTEDERWVFSSLLCPLEA